jgi:hypothetical protein
MFEQLRENDQRMTIREYVTRRANFRNEVLYAEDRGFSAMGDKLAVLMDEIFAISLGDLLPCNPPK